MLCLCCLVILFTLMLSIKFNDAAAVLAGANSSVTAAEAHGRLCGAFCASNDYDFAQWSDECLEDSEEGGAEATMAMEAAMELMRKLYAETLRAFRGDEMEFSPLLPDDDLPLARRAEGLAQWCQGFLFGFGSAVSQQRKLPPSVSEVLRDITQIARASAGDTEPTEEDEEDYMEIVEYVRIGVQTVHDELRPTLQ